MLYPKGRRGDEIGLIYKELETRPGAGEGIKQSFNFFTVIKINRVQVLAELQSCGGEGSK